MSSVERFAYPVSTMEELAPPVQAALAGQLSPDEAVRQIIFAPRQSHLARQRGLWARLSARLSEHRTPDWALVLTDDRLLLATIHDPTRPPQVSVTPLRALLWLELGTILLYSWFEWSWADHGRPVRQKVYFNTVRDDLFWQMANAMRRRIMAQAGRPRPTESRNSNVFAGLPFKFKNLIPARLMFPDEPVQVLVYQPALWGRRLGVFRHQRVPNTVLVLSPDHLLVAQDDFTNLQAAYGIIARYCPRDRLRRAALKREGEDLWLKVSLAADEAQDELDLLFDPGAEPALHRLSKALTNSLDEMSSSGRAGGNC